MNRARTMYDAVVVGSGATGSWAAKELTQNGLRTAVVEAGPALHGAGNASTRAQSQSRQPVQSFCYACTDQTRHLFVDDVDNPYSFPEGRPFRWIRGRQTGGRLHVWDRVALRMSDFEFKCASRDGVGEDWPISYADLATYYGHVERFMGVTGVPEAIPQLPDGVFTPPPPFPSGERALQTTLQRRWPTRRMTAIRKSQARPDAMLNAAEETGRLELFAESIATRVTVSENTGKAHSVAYLDAPTGVERELRGKVIVLCASAIESTRILLNSATPDHPNGLANSSGTLGRYLMDHWYGVDFAGVARKYWLSGEVASEGCYIPSFRNITEPASDFLRGYGLELRLLPPPTSLLSRWRHRLQRHDAQYWVSVFGEVLPRKENRVTLDPLKTDAWSVPVARIDCQYGSNESTMAADAFRSTVDMLNSAGFEMTRATGDLAPPGSSAHELGTARMGDNSETSVLNQFNQSWDIPNLYVTDGSSFASSGFQNPTLTMMALTVRACDHILTQLKSGGV